MAAQLRLHHHKKMAADAKKPKKRMGNPHWGQSGANSRGVSGNPSGNSKKLEKNRKPKKKKKRGNPNWHKGMTSPSPGAKDIDKNKYTLQDVIKAIQEVESEREEDLLIHFVKRAFENDTAMNNLFKKILPDLKSMEVSTDPEKPFQLIINTGSPIPPLETEDEIRE